MILELLLLLSLAAVFSFTYITIKHYGLWIKSPTAQLREKRVHTRQVMRILHGMHCPICGSRDTFVERVDLWQTNCAILTCNGCSQKALWKLEDYRWRLLAPYRHLPATPTQPASTLSREQLEEVPLEFTG